MKKLAKKIPACILCIVLGQAFFLPAIVHAGSTSVYHPVQKNSRKNYLKDRKKQQKKLRKEQQKAANKALSRHQTR